MATEILRDHFVVPARFPWPYKTWGRELRHILTRVQVGQPYCGHIGLVEPHASEGGVAACSENREWKMIILPALHTFAVVFGHCSVSSAKLCRGPPSLFGITSKRDGNSIHRRSLPIEQVVMATVGYQPVLNFPVSSRGPSTCGAYE